MELAALLDTVWFLLRHLLALLVFAATALIVGRRLTSALKLSPASVLEKWLTAIAIGIAAIGHGLFLLGLAGLLEPLALGLLILLAHLACRSAWRDVWNDVRGMTGRRTSATATAVALAAALLLSPVLLFPLYPPVSFDSTLYHLPYAKAFAATGGLPFLPSLRYPVFPQLMETLFAGMLLFSGDAGAQLLQLVATLVAAGLLFVWGREAFGPVVGWLGAAAYLGNPMVAYLAGTAFVEPGLALFATASLFALRRWRRSREPGWLTLAAVFASSAAATKYLGLFFVGAIGAIVLFTRWRSVFRYAAVAALVLVPWYGRIVLHTANPVFPYFTELFGASAWEHPDGGDEGSPLDALTLPWDLVFRRETFTWHPPVSPIYLVVLPLTLYAALRDPRVRRILVFAIAYAFCVRLLARDPRYLLPVLPLLSMTAAAGLAMAPLFQRRLAAVLALPLLLPGSLYVGRQIRRLGPLPVTAEGRSALLARTLPAYPAIRYLNRTRGRDYTLYAFHAENMAYFADGRFLGDWFGPASFERVLTAGATPVALHARLRALGVDHVLVVAERPPPLRLDDPEFSKRFRPVYADAGTRVFALGEP